MGICPQTGLATCVIGCCSADTRRSAAVLGRRGWHDASGGAGAYDLTARPSPKAGESKWNKCVWPGGRPGCGHRMSLPARSACSLAWEGRRWCARRHPPYESAIKPHVPIRGLRTSGAGGNTPQAIPAAGGEEACRHRRPSRARTLLARAHPRRKGGTAVSQAGDPALPTGALVLFLPRDSRL
jgi:hypothetical protein